MGAKITKTIVDRAHLAERDYFIWDSELSGFGLKICKGGRKTYVCKYRHGTGRRAPTRRLTIGAHGSHWTADEARREARQILGQAAQGKDPAKNKQTEKNTLTISELCTQYIQNGTATKKASTLATDNGRIERHIKPLLGHLRLTDVTRSTITKFMQDVSEGRTASDTKTGFRGRSIVKGGKGTATRTVGLLGGIFSYATDAGLMKTNPVRGVKRFKDKKNMRFLNAEELSRLGNSIKHAQTKGANPHAIAILRLLILTGCRKSEIENLTWHEIDLDLGFLRLNDSKTGQTIRPINGGAMSIIRSLPHFDNSNFVFPAATSNQPYKGTPKVWRKIREDAELEDVRLHDLRHSFASTAASSGASLPVIGALLGHKDAATTQRYAHLQDDPIREMTNSIGIELSQKLS